LTPNAGFSVRDAGAVMATLVVLAYMHFMYLVLLFNWFNWGNDCECDCICTAGQSIGTAEQKTLLHE
jgi:hypothetical protein